jgi:hypothetical protein
MAVAMKIDTGSEGIEWERIDMGSFKGLYNTTMQYYSLHGINGNRRGSLKSAYRKLLEGFENRDEETFRSAIGTLASTAYALALPCEHIVYLNEMPPEDRERYATAIEALKKAKGGDAELLKGMVSKRLNAERGSTGLLGGMLSEGLE